MVRIEKFLNIESPDMDWVLLHNKSQMKLFAKINQKQYLIPRECATPDTETITEMVNAIIASFSSLAM